MTAAPDPDAIASTRWKATFVGALVLVATILCSAVLHFRAMHALQHEVQDKLIRAALSVANRIDGDLHRTFTDPKQESSPEYERALQPLRDALFWRVNGVATRNDYRFIYTCTLVGDEVHFVLDPTPSHINEKGIDEKSHIMQLYESASSEMIAALHSGQPQADHEPYQDEWGTFVSGYAPFYDSAGRMAGVVGVDWIAETYAERLAGIRRAWYLQIVLCLASGFISGLGTGVAMARRARADAARLHAIEEARRNRERWRIMVETLPKPAVHLQENAVWINEPFTRTLGWTQDDLHTLDQWFTLLFHDQAEEARVTYLADRATGFDKIREVQAWHKDGRLRWVEFASHIYDPGEVWMIDDITERKEHHARLVEAREQAEAAAKAKGAFLATVSHEIRTPMNGVIGMTNLILETTLDARQREMAETIRNSGEALIVVINDILDFSKIESGGMELENAPFDLRACVEDCLHLFAAPAAKKNLQLVYHLPPACPAIVRGDSTRFRQVLCNLIGNAVKFTEQGEVEVWVRPLCESTPAPGDAFTLAIGVRDTGIGIPADRLDRLFKSFSQVDSSMTRKYGGTGLGLAISRRLAELMGGNITVRSEAGQGSTFTLTMATHAEASPPSPVFAARATLQGVRVLLVESHAPTAEFIESYLRLWGMECTAVPDATQALRQVRDFGPVPLLLTALQLPGMDGLDLCRALASVTSQPPKVILLSSTLREDLVGEARAAGIADVLTKPVRPAALLQTIEATLATPASGELAPAAPAPAVQAAPQLAAERPLRILVAEDNPVNQLVAHHTFARLGYQITIVGDGEQAVSAAQAKEYDVIFMDVQMPNMNGYEATQRIRATSSGLRRPFIVALTASVLEGDHELCLRHGMDDFLPKPIRFADLERVLRSIPLN